jgi:uncharacterized protein (TIGR04255 family)
MKSPTVPDPFTGAAPPEIPLKRAPLVSVVAQIRFPRILSINNPTFVGAFQNKIRREYPIVEEAKVHTIHFSMVPQQEPELKPESIWRFSNKDNTWRVSLGPDFLSMDSRSYVSRTDFIKKLTSVVTAVQETIAPGPTLRIGVRYTTRVVSPEFDKLDSILDKEVLGLATRKPFMASHIHLMTDASFKTTEGDARLRFGFLPANGVIDPEMPPHPEKSWICDIDSASDASLDFKKEEIESVIAALAQRSYAIFRALVTPSFLKAYGGIDATTH